MVTETFSMLKLKELRFHKTRVMQPLSSSTCTLNLIQFRWTVVEKQGKSISTH